jgi:RNA polymerase sigma factor (sigma-70 family)
MRGPSPFLRLQADERLVELTRRGNQAAYEVLVSRYNARLVAFTRHMLGSKEDAEDVVQETFAAAYSAMCADDRPINVRPWLYRIARNRSLNHMRRQQPIGVDSLDHHVGNAGASTADTVHGREEFRQIVADVQELPETQRTALLLREIDALSYDQIAEAMDTTVPSVKSLLVRARVGLAEAAEARNLSCEEVREELGEVAEGLKRISPPVRRHARECERCGAFQKTLKHNNKQLALAFPIGFLLIAKKLFLAQAGTTASAGGATATAAASTAAGTATGGSLAAGMSAIATKAAATVAAAAIVTVGTVEVDQSARTPVKLPASIVAQVQPAKAAPAAVPAVKAAPIVKAALAEKAAAAADAKAAAKAKADAAATPAAAADPTTAVPVEQPTVAIPVVPDTPQQQVDVVAAPERQVDTVILPVDQGGSETIVTPPTATAPPAEQGTAPEPSITNPPDTTTAAPSDQLITLAP